MPLKAAVPWSAAASSVASAFQSPGEARSLAEMRGATAATAPTLFRPHFPQATMAGGEAQQPQAPFPQQAPPRAQVRPQAQLQPHFQPPHVNHPLPP